MACHFDPAGIAPQGDTIAGLQRFSRFSIELLNLFRCSPREPDRRVRLQHYAGVIVHSSVFCHPDGPERRDAEVPFRRHEGVKVLLKQEGHVLPAHMAALVADLAFEAIDPEPRQPIERFAAFFDERLEKLLADKGVPARPVGRIFRPARHVLLLCAHAPRRDPRIAWVADHAGAGTIVHVVGADSGLEAPVDALRELGGAELVAPSAVPVEGLSGLLRVARGSGSGWDTLALFDVLLQGRADALARSIGTSFDALPALRFLLRRFLQTNLALALEGFRFSNVHAVVAADLEALPAGVILKQAFGVPLLYDAHEFWPDSSDGFQAPDMEFWKAIEQNLLRDVERAYTVSPPLAAHMTELYAREFASLPNCEPLRGKPAADPRYRPDGLPGDACVFLYQGGYAVGRGLDRLVDAWRLADPRAVLVFRGPPSAYEHFLRGHAAQTGLAGKRIFFMDSIGEGELVQAASSADVGLIPYEPTSINNRGSCPNKLSQYMAAGIPILHNRLAFVADTVSRASCGVEADFADPTALAGAVNALVGNAAHRAKLGAAGRHYFEAAFNWQTASTGFYADLAQLMQQAPMEECSLYAAPPLFARGRRGDFQVAAWDAAHALWQRVPFAWKSPLLPVARAIQRLLER